MNELLRDTNTNRIISYADKRSSENKGSINVPVADERFLDTDFRFVVKTEFSTLPEAVNAEANVFKQYKEYQSILLSSVPLANISPAEIDTLRNVAKNELLKNLDNLIMGNENSVEALKQKVSELESIIDSKNNQLDEMFTAQSIWNETISAWTQENIDVNIRADALERTNRELSRQQEETLDAIKLDVELQTQFVSSSLSSLAGETGRTLNALSDEITAIRAFNRDLPDLSNIVTKKFSNAGTAGSAGSAGGG